MIKQTDVTEMLLYPAKRKVSVEEEIGIERTYQIR